MNKITGWCSRANLRGFHVGDHVAWSHGTAKYHGWIEEFSTAELVVVVDCMGVVDHSRSNCRTSGLHVSQLSLVDTKHDYTPKQIGSNVACAVCGVGPGADVHNFGGVSPQRFKVGDIIVPKPDVVGLVNSRYKVHEAGWLPKSNCWGVRLESGWWYDENKFVGVVSQFQPNNVVRLKRGTFEGDLSPDACYIVNTASPQLLMLFGKRGKLFHADVFELVAKEPSYWEHYVFAAGQEWKRDNDGDGTIDRVVIRGVVKDHSGEHICYDSFAGPEVRKRTGWREHADIQRWFTDQSKLGMPFRCQKHHVAFEPPPSKYKDPLRRTKEALANLEKLDVSMPPPPSASYSAKPLAVGPPKTSKELQAELFWACGVPNTTGLLNQLEKAPRLEHPDEIEGVLSKCHPFSGATVLNDALAVAKVFPKLLKPCSTIWGAMVHPRLVPVVKLWQEAGRPEGFLETYKTQHPEIEAVTTAERQEWWQKGTQPSFGYDED